MLKNWARPEKPEGEELKQRLKAAEEKLSQQQMKLKEKRLPVLVLIEGWGAAGKGSAIGQIIKNIDPPVFQGVLHALHPHGGGAPPALPVPVLREDPRGGEVHLFGFRLDGPDYEGAPGRQAGRQGYAQRVDSVKRFERGLTDNGYLVLKFFFHISKKEQESRIEALLSEKDTAWRVSEGDLWLYTYIYYYDKCLEAFDRYLDDTNTPSAPGTLSIPVQEVCELQVMETLCMGIETALHNESLQCPCCKTPSPLSRCPSCGTSPWRARHWTRKSTKRS